VDAEWIAFVAGLKPAIRRTVDPVDLARVEAQLRAPGVVVLRARETALLGGREQAVLYVARSREHAETLRAAEEGVLPGRGVAVDARERHATIGRLLGFPACCVEAFLGRLDRGVDRLEASGPGGLAEDYVAVRSAWVSTADARINPLLMSMRAQLVSFYPCRYDCPVAVGLAEGVRAALAAQQPNTAASLMGLLSRPVAVAPDGGRALLELDAARTGIARAATPRRSNGTSDPRDVALAGRLAGARVIPGGEVAMAPVGAPPVWCVDFGGVDSGGVSRPVQIR
jgi:hypothetical protein